MQWLIVLAVFPILIVLACCRVSGQCSRQEEKEMEHHCENCVRWSECNGVDDECPWRIQNRG